MNDCRATAAAPFVLEVLARWMHQSSTRELSKLGNIQVKIWVLPFTEGEMDALIGEFEKLLRAALRHVEEQGARALAGADGDAAATAGASVREKAE